MRANVCTAPPPSNPAAVKPGSTGHQAVFLHPEDSLNLIQTLQSGGDHRLIPNAEGLSPYRATTEPSDQLPFSSCTASSMGTLGFAAADQVFTAWQDAGASDAVLATAMQDVRTGLRDVFSLPTSTVLPLLPSGTDALYIVSCLALARTARVHHVIVGASELGSGTRAASEGRSFSPIRPLGEGPDAADLPDLAEHCSTEAVYLRDATGRRRSIHDIDADVSARVEAAIVPGTTVVVHLVDHSKTGLRAPSMELCSQLTARYGDRVLILVDAAQGRLAPADIRSALELGFVVMFTGSKFYSGPPFSCALFIPPAWSADPGALPKPLSDWFTRDGMPDAWPEATASLTHAANPGLTLRWAAAMAEISTYHAIPPRRRASVYATFAGAVHEVLGACSALDLEFPIPPVHGLASGLASFPTVFGFRVRKGDHWFTKPELKSLHAGLDTALDSEQTALSTRYHIGQPVVLGPPDGEKVTLLRVALGARLVTQLAHEPDAGGRWFRERLQGLVTKLDVLLLETTA